MPYAAKQLAYDRAMQESLPMMDRMIAMQAPICTTRLLPTRVSCRHPMFSLSSTRSIHQDASLCGCHSNRSRYAALAHTSKLAIHQHIEHMPGQGMHACQLTWWMPRWQEDSHAVVALPEPMRPVSTQLNPCNATEDDSSPSIPSIASGHHYQQPRSSLQNRGITR